MTGNSSKSKATLELVELGLRPRLIDDEKAAAFLGLSANAFRKAVSEGRYPPAIRDGRRQRWDLKALEATVDRRSGLTPSHAMEETPDVLMEAIDAD